MLRPVHAGDRRPRCQAEVGQDHGSSRALGRLEIHPDSAVVLVFVNRPPPAPRPNGSFARERAVKVGMNKIDGNWLISSFDPV